MVEVQTGTFTTVTPFNNKNTNAVDDVLCLYIVTRVVYCYSD